MLIYLMKGVMIYMKKVNMISFLRVAVLALVLSNMSPVTVVAATAVMDNMPYDFPVTPDDDGWKEFTTKQEMLDVCQIPQNKLENMTTEALLETVLNYPLIGTYTAFNSIEDACAVMSDDFNGFDELFSRSDISEILMEKYSGVQVVTAKEVEIVPTEEFFLPSTIEYLFACDEIKNGEYSDKQAEEVYDLLDEKMKERESAGIYSTASEVYANYMLQKSGVNMLQAGENFKKVTIKTPKGSVIPEAYSRSPEYTKAEIKEINEWYDKEWPLAKRVSSATIKYNCHSYAWYNRSTSNAYWIDKGPASIYVKDGIYSKYTGGTARSGMIYYYNGGEHSGVAIGTEMVSGAQVFYVRSKWGSAPLYEHPFNYCPYSSKHVLYSKS